MYSIAELNETVSFPPEFGAYVLDPTRGNSPTVILDSANSIKDFTQSETSLNSLLNTASTRSFYVAYQTNDMSQL